MSTAICDLNDVPCIQTSLMHLMYLDMRLSALNWHHTIVSIGLNVTFPVADHQLISWFWVENVWNEFRIPIAIWLMCHTCGLNFQPIFKLCSWFQLKQLILDIGCGTKIKMQHLTGIHWWWFQASNPQNLHLHVAYSQKKVWLRTERCHRSDWPEIWYTTPYHTIFWPHKISSGDSNFFFPPVNYTWSLRNQECILWTCSC